MADDLTETGSGNREVIKREPQPQIEKRGRIVSITHPEWGITHLLDVTESLDETTGGEGYEAERVSDLMS